MLQIKKTEYFSGWHANLKDARARAKINLRIEQVKLGNFGDFKLLLLAGGDKSTQQKDIDKAKELNNEKK